MVCYPKGLEGVDRRIGEKVLDSIGVGIQDLTNFGVTSSCERTWKSDNHQDSIEKALLTTEGPSYSRTQSLLKACIRQSCVSNRNAQPQQVWNGSKRSIEGVIDEQHPM